MGVHTATEPVVRMLGRVPLFQSLPRTDLERIAGLAAPRQLEPGEFLYRQGDPGDRFYVVERGEIEILRERPLADHEILAVKRAGDTFGERSLLNEAPRTTSARAAVSSRLLAFERREFDALLGGDSLASRLLRSLARANSAPDVRLGGRDPAVAGDAVRRFGRRVTRGLEPKSAPAVDGLSVAGGASRGEAAPGRSLWDALRTEDGRTVLALLAVKGSGVPPGYLIGVGRALLHETARSGPFDTLADRLNAATFHNLFEGTDDCVEAALVEVDGHTVRWTAAGDPSAALLQADGSVRSLPSLGPPLGILQSFEYGVQVVDLDAGDTLLAFSEPSERVLLGAADLLRQRPSTDPAQLVRLLQVALPSVEDAAAEVDLAFIALRRR